MTPPLPCRLFPWLLPLFLTLLATSAATAANPPACQVELRVITATKAQPKEADPRLADVAKRIESLFGYHHFTLVSSARQEAAPGADMTFSLPTAKKLTLKVENAGEPRTLLVSLVLEGLLTTQYRVENGGVLLVGGMKAPGEGVYVLAIRAALGD